MKMQSPIIINVKSFTVRGVVDFLYLFEDN